MLLALPLFLVMAQEEESKEKPTKPPFHPPSRPSGDVYLAESFSNPDEVWKTWLKSTATKEGTDSDIAKYNGKNGGKPGRCVCCVGRGWATHPSSGATHRHYLFLLSLLCPLSLPSSLTYRQLGTRRVVS